MRQRYQCPKCPKSYAWPYSLTVHDRRDHGQMTSAQLAMDAARRELEKLPPDARLAAVAWLEMVFLREVIKKTAG